MNTGNSTRLALIAAFVFVLAAAAGVRAAANPPMPCGPVPSAVQLSWAEGDLALLVQLGMNTFIGQDQATGKEDPKLFNPAKLDARQWVKVAKEAGVKRMILTAKNHDGFCLWPSCQTDYSVRNSPWREGTGDIVKEFVEACRQEGIEAGIYLSCEDRNHPAYGTPAYNAVYTNQLAELLTGYGPLSEIRFDNTGGEGAGAYGSLSTAPKDRKQVYDWQGYFTTVRRLEPKMIMVGVVGPGARWNGNNNGHLGEPNWAPFDLSSMPGLEPADPKQLRVLNSGDPNGTVWLPCECCVGMRTNWSWRAEDDAQVMPLDRLFNTWCKSIGRGAVLLLNVPINRDGLISDADAQRLRELHVAVEALFKTDLAAGKPATASNVRGHESSFAASNAVDGKRDTYWATDDVVTNDCWLEVDLGKETQFDTSAVREQIALGQRVASYRIEVPDGDQWKLVVRGTTVGRLKVERFKPVTASKVRLVIEKSRACPTISQFSLYLK